MAEKTKKTITVPQDSDIANAIKTTDFKQSLVDTLQESNTARNEMKVVLHEILRQPDTIVEIKNIIDKIDRDEVKAFWKKFGFATWSAILFMAGVVFTAVVQNLIS